MGNELPTIQPGPDVEVHPKFGNIRVKTVGGSSTEEPQRTMELYCLTDDEDEYKKWAQKVKEVDDAQIREIVLLPTRKEYESSGFCGHCGLIKVTYEYFPFQLSEEIENRGNLKNNFHEIQIWYIMYFIVMAGAKMEKHKGKIGDVNPKNIFINDYGEIRMVSTRSIPNQLTNYKKFSSNKAEKVFLAPQELNQELLMLGQYPKEVDPCRAEVFSIGAVLLSMGVLEEVNSIYQEFMINEKELEKFLSIFEEKYSFKLHEVLGSMMRIDPKKRKSCSAIYKQIKVHEKDIINLTPLEEWQKQ